PKVFDKTALVVAQFKADTKVWANVIGENDLEKSFSIVSLPNILAEYNLMLTSQYTSTGAPISINDSLRLSSGEEIRDLIRQYLNDNQIPDIYKSLTKSLLPKDFEPDSNIKVKTMALYVSLNGSLSDKEIEEIELHMRDDIIDDIRGDGVEMYSYAFGLLSDSYAEAEAAMEGPFMLTVIAIFALSLINYRRLSDALLANLTLLIVIIWTFCIIGIIGFNYNFLNIMVPLLITGLAIDFSFHAIIGYRERLWGKNKPEKLVKNAAVAMISFVGVAFLLATVTTTFGFVSNIISDLPAIAEFGIGAALGIVFACVLNITFVPAMRVILDKRRLKKGKELKGAIPPEKIAAKPGKILGPLSKTVKYPWALLVVLIILAIPGYYLLPNMRATYDPTGELLDNQDITQAFRVLNKDYSVGTESILVRIDGDFENPELWQAVNSSINNAANDVYIATDDGIAKVEWIGVMLTTIGTTDPNYMAIDSNQDGIPDPDTSPLNIRLMLDNLSSNFPMINQYIHKGPQGYDGVVIRFISRTNLGEYGFKAKDELKEDMQPVYDLSAKVEFTGEPIIWNKGLDDFRESLIMSTILVLIFAFVLLIIVFGVVYKSPALGFLTAIPPILAIGWTLSFMALVGIPLNMMTAFVGSFTVGLGIDYPIHLVTRWVDERKRGNSIIKCYTISIRSTGKELGFSALTTLSAFIAFALMPMPVMKEFGIVMVAAIVFSFLGAVFLMPMLIRFWHRKEKT
ncbi:efflux RND transporter permease subunit, partial [[Eubacterium] cellulosolvens]